MEGEATKPALAELKEQGATPDGDDKNSVAAAAMLAVDLASGEVDFSHTRILALCFRDNGDISVYSVSDEEAEKVEKALEASEAGTVAAADIEKAFSLAVEPEAMEEAEHKLEAEPKPEMKAEIKELAK